MARAGELSHTCPVITRTGIACSLALVFALGTLAHSPALAQDRTAAEALELADGIAGVWPAQQRENGSFSDYVYDRAGGSGGYGEAMLGLALLESGTRNRDDVRIGAGMRAIDHSVFRQPRMQSVFGLYAVASAYALAQTRLAGDPSFELRRPYWAWWLQAARRSRIGGPKPLFNKYLVEAAAWLALLRTGLRSSEPGTVLFERTEAEEDVIELVGETIPNRVRSRARRARGASPGVFADPPHHPLAYHAMSLGWLTTVENLLGEKAPARARKLARHGARASLELTAPDGDLAYAGRAQEQSWALSFTAYGAVAAARTASRGRAAELRALAARALERLRALHPITPEGVLITPAVASPGGLRGLDGYAGAGVYNGLTLLGLAWTGHHPTSPGRTGRLPADRRGSNLLDMGGSDQATVRRGRVWFAVRQHHMSKSVGDLRYDQGLVALKRRSRSGWRDLVRLRPRTHRPGDSAGPLLLRRSRKKLMPWGSRLRLGRGGRVHQHVRLDGRRTITYKPLRSGVRITWRARRGERFEYSLFLPAAPVERRGRVVGGGLRVSSSVPLKITRVERGYASGRDSPLVRARTELRARRTGAVSLVLR